MELLKAKDKAQELMNKFGLTSQGWTFTWFKSVNSAGRCSYRYMTIGLGKQYTKLHSQDEVIDTILHEIAHALVGKGKGHGREWKAMCRRIGAKPERCFDNGKRVEKRYKADCPKCGKRFLSQRFTKAMRRGQQYHGACERKVSSVEDIYLTWSANENY